MRVRIYLGSDITSNLIIARLLRLCIGSGHSFEVFEPMQAVPRPPRSKAYAKYLWFERIVLREFVEPILVARRVESPNVSTLAEVYGPQFISVQRIASANHEDAVSYDAHDMTFSVRWHEKFSEATLKRLGSGGRPTINLHPGKLPDYRGVFTYLRAMIAGEPDASFTAHTMNAEWDAGPIVGQVTESLDYSLSVLENMVNHHVRAADLLLTIMAKRTRSEDLLSISQGSGGSYFSTPDDETLDQAARLGIETASEWAIRKLVRTYYGDQVLANITEGCQYRQN